MGVATLAGRAFRLDPESVEWEYRIKYVDTPTVGGKVVQILGANFGDMTLVGSFGLGGWEEQATFLTTMKEMADKQVKDAGTMNSSAEPFRFAYPTKGWDFLVYLKAFSNPDGPTSVSITADMVNPKWQLTLFIVEDNAGLRKAGAGADAFIGRLAAGLGWKKTKYNGPLDMSEVETLLAGRGLQGYLQDEFGYAPGNQTPAGNQEVAP